MCAHHIDVVGTAPWQHLRLMCSCALGFSKFVLPSPPRVCNRASANQQENFAELSASNKTAQDGFVYCGKTKKQKERV
jgi:hypothetical protein